MGEWISVDDRLPEPSTYCLIWAEGRVDVAYVKPNGNFAITELYGVRVNYWQPLPPPPTDS